MTVMYLTALQRYCGLLLLTVNAGVLPADEPKKPDDTVSQIQSSVPTPLEVTVERKDTTESMVLKIGGPKLQLGEKHEICLDGKSLGLKYAPSMRTKSCGCITPLIDRTSNDGTWKLKIGLNLEPTTSSHDYRELIIFDFDENEPLPPGRDSLRVRLDFRIDQPAWFEIDRNAIRYDEDKLQVTGRWREGFPIEDVKFDFGQNFEAVAERTPARAEALDGYDWVGTWNLKVRSVSVESPAFCRLMISAHGKIDYSWSFSLASATNTFDILRTGALQREDMHWVTDILLATQKDKPLTREKLEVTAPGCDLSWTLTKRSERVYDLRVRVSRRSDDLQQLELTLETDESSESITLPFPPG